MSEENVTPEQTTETEETPVTPELTDEQIAAALGVEVDYFQEVKGQINDLHGLYKKVNEKSRQLADEQRKREAESKTTPAPSAEDDDEDIELDEKSQRALDRWFQKHYGSVLTTVQQQKTEAMSTVIDDFGAKYPDADHLSINAIMDELGLWDVSDTPAKLKKNLERAKKISEAEKFDPEAEAERIAAERLKSKVKDGEEVVEVKKKAGTVPKARSEAEILADQSIPWFEKEKLLSQK
jgi:hypothetical protein